MALDSVLNIEALITFENKFPKYGFEQRGNITQRVYSREFSKEYHKRLNNMVERRLKASIKMTGSIWYTAWVDAGQPDLSSLLSKKPSNEFLKELEELENKHTKHKQSGRDCD